MLAVDIGNTSSRVAVFAGESIQARRSFPTAGLTADGLAGPIAELAGLLAPAEKKILHAASVVPAANEILAEAAARARLAVRFIRSGTDDIIAHALATPVTTGVDRLLAALAAGRVMFAGTAGKRGYVVVQCGTAATVDVVDGEGVFRGGYILPGPGMWLRGLAAAAQLPDLSEGADLPAEMDVAAARPPAPGRCTRGALLAGLRAGLPGAVLAAARAAAEGLAEGLPAAVPVAVTGGWGRTALAALGPGARYEPDLVLLGVRLHARRLEE